MFVARQLSKNGLLLEPCIRQARSNVNIREVKNGEAHGVSPSEGQVARVSSSQGSNDCGQLVVSANHSRAFVPRVWNSEFPSIPRRRSHSVAMARRMVATKSAGQEAHLIMQDCTYRPCGAGFLSIYVSPGCLLIPWRRLEKEIETGEGDDLT